MTTLCATSSTPVPLRIEACWDYVYESLTSDGRLYFWRVPFAISQSAVCLVKVSDFFQSRVWLYIDAPREHTGYVRFVRRYSPTRLRRKQESAEEASDSQAV
jgi:hypothetical protein